MWWFGQLYHSRFGRLLLCITLVVLGIVLEVIQGRLPHRWFDMLDAAANAGGVLLATFFLSLGTDKFLYWLQQRLL